MDYITYTHSGEKFYLLPISDVHIGDQAFNGKGKAKLLANLEWAEKNSDHVRILLLGDIFNIASRTSKTTPFESDPREILVGTRLFRPFKHLILGALHGNHEQRIADSHGFDPTELFCEALEIPYLGASALLRLRVGQRKDNPEWAQQTYFVAAHHTTGGGRKLGSSLNGVEQLSLIIPGCDVYLGGHNHQLSTATSECFIPTNAGPERRVSHFVSCGSYLSYAGYVENKMYRPGRIGSPRVRFSGTSDRDVRVSL